MFGQLKQHPMYTTGLYYRKYTHLMRMDAGDRHTLDEILGFCDAELGGRYRKRIDKRGRSLNLRIYCDRSAYDAISSRYGNHVRSAVTPLDIEAEQCLLRGIGIAFRDRPWYGRYRYAIQFYTDHDVRADLKSWISDSLGSDKTSHMFRGNGYFPVLYAKDESVLTMVRLGAPARIIGIRRVYTAEEVAGSIR